MSWKAVDWATDADVGSPTLKLILILLANKADERFSCFPSIRTLMSESGAGRSTVLRALKTLEGDGLVTRRAQFHDSGAQRSSRYFLNHPDAPHLSPRPESTPPGPTPKRRPVRRETEGVSYRDPTGESVVDPNNPSREPPSESDDAGAALLQSLPPPWTVGRKDRVTLAPKIDAALRAGWDAKHLADYLAKNPTGVRFPARVLMARLADLPAPPVYSTKHVSARAPWCGECEDSLSRTVTVIQWDGSDGAAFCPRCSPQAQNAQAASVPCPPLEER
ncbi:helix-turn-helix domain-containing protein [Antrihabitans sp. YC3-6]|uniref:Helix-turn-helix domain-containing protein n=1 Tax=Antrihabitans stalagmiti TaxID=2799499 RepID=A0A934U707_9NOCA|nr:helix-turn-helix domain-containing protein [Antrihabitans stalagmiti]MBJ8343007.1 helix-turn-helix domain-containing protein [Antrihabitans stalagmiti]